MKQAAKENLRSADGAKRKHQEQFYKSEVSGGYSETTMSASLKGSSQ